jgi:hypothetical protein
MRLKWNARNVMFSFSVVFMCFSVMMLLNFDTRILDYVNLGLRDVKHNKEVLLTYSWS